LIVPRRCRPKWAGEQVVEITEDNDPNDLIGRPNGYVKAAVIYDPRIPECDNPEVSCGATVEVFADESAAKRRSDYIQGLMEEAPILGSEYHYLDGATLLRVSGDLDPSAAEEYEAAF
jgi:hypothetical protein